MDTLLDEVDVFVAATDAGFEQVSKELVAVDNKYLDGPYDKHALVRRLQENAHVLAERYLLMGRDLLVLKAHADHGEFGMVLDEIGIGQRSANRFMQVAIKFGKPTLLTVAQRFPVAKLLELAQFDDEDLVGLLDGGGIGTVTLDSIDRMSASELKKALRKQMKARNDAEEVNNQRILDKNKTIDDMDRQLKMLNIIPDVEDWPAHVAETTGRLGVLTTFSESSIKNILSYADSRTSLEMTVEAKESLCKSYIHEINKLSHWVGKCQDFANHAFAEFVDAPVYQMDAEVSVKPSLTKD